MCVPKTSEGYQLLFWSLTGPEMEKDAIVEVGDQQFYLFRPDERAAFARHVFLAQKERPVVAIDFSQPDAVVGNAQFYCEHGIPFVMGTTGGDRDQLRRIVEASNICAVIAPNMAAQVVAFQAAMEWMATNYPYTFADFELAVRESHQQGKKDTSGTAKAMIGYFNRLGIVFDPDQIQMVRDPAEQLAMGVPEEHLGGHGHHAYRLTLPDGTMQFEVVHNINGRKPYVMGTMKALAFLTQQVQAGVQGRVFSMGDVLEAG